MLYLYRFRFKISTSLGIRYKVSYALIFFIVNFKNDRNAAINLIKWLNTDFVNFLVMYYKSAPSNSAVLFQNIPQPPTYGDFSDKTLMDKFGLTSEQMEHIHKSMIEFGFKTSYHICL